MLAGKVLGVSLTHKRYYSAQTSANFNASFVNSLFLAFLLLSFYCHHCCLLLLLLLFFVIYVSPVTYRPPLCDPKLNCFSNCYIRCNAFEFPSARTWINSQLNWLFSFPLFFFNWSTTDEKKNEIIEPVCKMTFNTGGIHSCPISNFNRIARVHLT